MGRRLYSRRAERIALVLFLPFLIALTACTNDAEQPVGTPTALVAAGAEMNLEGMVSDAGAIVIGTVPDEAVPLQITHRTLDGSEEVTVTDRFRHFVVEIEKSYLPGVEDSATIGVSVQTNRRNPGTADPVTIFDAPEIEVGRRMILFLRYSDRWNTDDMVLDSPEGFVPESHFIIYPYGDDESFSAGALADDGDRWVHLPTGASTTLPEIEQAVEGHGAVVPRDCHRFSIGANVDYVAKGVREHMENSHAVIKGRMGGDFARENGDLAVEVLEVVVGDVPFDTIQLVGYTLERDPGFGTCDYYLFLSKEIDFNSMDMEAPDDRSHIFRLAFGPQSAFAVHDGMVEKGHWFPGVERQGVTEDKFLDAVLGPAVAATATPAAPLVTRVPLVTYGRLTNYSDCLKVGEHVLLFATDLHDVHVDQDRIVVRRGADEEIFTIGQYVTVTGGPSFRLRSTIESIPHQSIPEHCEGPFWLVDDVLAEQPTPEPTEETGQ